MAAIRSRAAESNGGPEGTEALYRAHGTAVAALCRSLLRDRGEAEDATQQVFLSAHRALLNGAAPREPLSWLLAVARNECYARFRQRAATPVPTDEEPDGATPDVSVHVLRAGEMASLWNEVGQLPAAQRETFLLREIRGLSYGQLAAQLSTTPPSVRSHLLRARTRLRRRLGDASAALGGVPWVQQLLRAFVGGDGSSPVPAAAKAAVVGLGALALAGGGSQLRVPQHASTAPRHPAPRHRADTSMRHVAAPPFAPAATPHRDAPRVDDRSSAGSDRSGAGGGSGDSGGGSGDDAIAATAPIAPASTSSDGHDGSSGSGDTATITTTTTTTVSQTSSDGGSDGGVSGSDSGSTTDGPDGGSGGS